MPKIFRISMFSATLLIAAGHAFAQDLDCNKCVDTNDINWLAVTGGKIANSTISAKKLSTNAVTTEKINWLAVTSGKIANGAVTDSKIKDGAVTPDKLSPDVLALGLSGMVTIPAAAFIPAYVNDGEALQFYEGYIYSVSGLACARAPVNLPDGAVIDQLVGFLWDDNPDQLLFLDFKRTDYLSGETTRLARVQSSVKIPAIQLARETSINFPNVNINRYAYWLLICLPVWAEGSPTVQQRLYAVRIAIH